MMNSIFSDEISCLNSQRLGLISNEVWTRANSENVLNADFENSKYTCRFDILYRSDRAQIPVQNVSERDLMNDDQRIENFCKKNRNPDSGSRMKLLFPDG